MLQLFQLKIYCYKCYKTISCKIVFWLQINLYIRILLHMLLFLGGKKMKKGLFWKELVLGIIVLFVGVSIAPGINASIETSESQSPIIEQETFITH